MLPGPIRLSSGRFATEFRHSVAKDIVDRCALAAGNALLQGRYPGSNGIERRPDRLCRHDARDADVCRLLLAGEQNFMQPLARTNTGKCNFDVTDGMQPGMPDNTFRKIDDFEGLAHIENVNRRVVVAVFERMAR